MVKCQIHARLHTHKHTHIDVYKFAGHLLKKVFAGRRNAAGFSRLTSSGTLFSREAALWEKERWPAAVFVVGGRRYWSCLVARSQWRDSAKVQNREASSSAHPAYALFEQRLPRASHTSGVVWTDPGHSRSVFVCKINDFRHFFSYSYICAVTSRDFVSKSGKCLRVQQRHRFYWNCTQNTQERYNIIWSTKPFSRFFFYILLFWPPRFPKTTFLLMTIN